jgi:hypothetical protein
MHYSGGARVGRIIPRQPTTPAPPQPIPPPPLLLLRHQMAAESSSTPGTHAHVSHPPHFIHTHQRQTRARGSARARRSRAAHSLLPKFRGRPRAARRALSAPPRTQRQRPVTHAFSPVSRADGGMSHPPSPVKRDTRPNDTSRAPAPAAASASPPSRRRHTRAPPPPPTTAHLRHHRRRQLQAAHTTPVHGSPSLLPGNCASRRPSAAHPPLAWGRRHNDARSTQSPNARTHAHARTGAVTAARTAPARRVARPVLRRAAPRGAPRPRPPPPRRFRF